MKITLTAAITAALTIASPAFADSPLKVGMITTLSGGGASLGTDVRDGFLLAIDKHGESKIDVIIADDQAKPDIGVQLATKMIESDKVDVLTGLIWSNLAMAIVPSVTAQGKFYLSANAGPSALAGKGCHENYFNVAWQNDNLHEAAGAYSTEAGYKNSFLLAPNYPAGKDALAGYKRFYKGEIAGEIYSKLDQRDYAAEIAQIRASGADSVFFFLPGGMGIAFVKQYAQSGIDTPLVGPGFSFDQNILQAVGDAAIGVVNTAQWNKDLDFPANHQFVKEYVEAYGRLPSIQSSQGYDTALLLISALQKADVSDKSAFREALRAADFKSTRGDFSFGNNHHPIQTIYAREVVKEGDIYTNKLIKPILVNHTDAYAGECKM